MEEHDSAAGQPAASSTAELRIIVLEGDETGQELLEQALRVLDPGVIKVPVELEHYDLSLENRRRTNNEVVSRAAEAMSEARFGLKAATITPEGKDDVGSPNRLLREAIDGKVIIRTGRRIPGRHARGGSPLPDRRGPHGGGRRLWRRGAPRGAERRRDRVPDRAHLAEHLPGGGRVQLPHRGTHPRPRVRRAEMDGEPGVRGHAQGGDGRGLRAPPRGALQPGADRRHLRRPDQWTPPTLRS